MVEILRISSFLVVFFYRSLLNYRCILYSFGRKPRFFLKSAYPLNQIEEADSNFAFETASLLLLAFKLGTINLPFLP